jgi:hypothetical protein
VQSIVTNYQTGSVGGVFSCANNGFKGWKNGSCICFYF